MRQKQETRKLTKQTDLRIWKLLLAILIFINFDSSKADNYWHCGTDDDSCTEKACLCMPLMPDNTSCCLDYGNDKQPCSIAPKSGCAEGIPITPSQHACLNSLFLNNCTNQEKPQFNCSLICNPEAGECRVPQPQ